MYSLKTLEYASCKAYQTTRHVSVRRTPTALAIPLVIQLPSD